jgi:class 3 adenylate cyclase
MDDNGSFAPLNAADRGQRVPAQMRGEKETRGRSGPMKSETVTIMFTDLVESTELLNRFGESRAEAIRRAHFGLLRSVIDRHRGREVKNLGDGLMVVFESAVDAVTCGATMQRRVQLQADEGNGTVHVQMRVAISTGEADVENEDYFGWPVVEASRLCAQCPPGQILISGLTRTLVGSRTKLNFKPLGEMVLKGLKAVAHDVDWRGSGSAAQLHITIGNAKTTIDLHTQSLRIGRAKDNDIAIEDHGVSRLHARIEHESGLWRLIDLGSTNGTRVNGKAVPCWHARVLSDGDLIAIGDAELEFVDDACNTPFPDQSTLRKEAPTEGGTP